MRMWESHYLVALPLVHSFLIQDGEGAFFQVCLGWPRSGSLELSLVVQKLLLAVFDLGIQHLDALVGSVRRIVQGWALLHLLLAPK